MIALLFSISVVNNLDRHALSVLSPTLQKAMGFTSVEYSYMVTAFLAAYGIGYLFSGRLIDRLGVRLALGAALGFWSIVCVLHGAVTGWLGLIAARFFLGLGESFNSPGGIKGVAEWMPSRERGLGVAIFANGHIWGAIIAAPLIAFLALHVGWRWGFIVPGGIGLIVCLVWWRCYHRPEAHPRLTTEERQYILENRRNDEGGEAVPLRRLLLHPLCIGFFFARLLTDPFSYFFHFWLPDYFQHERGFTLAMMAWFAWITCLAGDVGGPLGGFLSDVLVRQGVRPIRARFVLLGIATIAMPLANVAVRTQSSSLAIAILAVMFAAQTCWMANQLALLAEAFPPRAVGTVIAISAVGGTIGGVLASLLTGRTVQAYGYVPVFTAMSFLHVTALVGVTMALRRHERGGAGGQPGTLGAAERSFT
jgi:ACS family hexuronate transporter-like MFS transporter